MPLFGHGLAEVFQMVGQPLFLLADVEFFDIIDEFLLQPVLVVVHFRNLFQPLHDVGPNLLHPRFLVRFDAGQQRSDVVYLLGELPLQSLPLLTAESHKRVDGLPDGPESSLPLSVGELFHLGLGRHVGHTEQCVKPVRGLGDARLGGNVLDLAIVVFHKCHIHRCGIGRSVFFHPNGEIHFTTFQLLGYQLSDFHFLLPVERSDARGEIERLAVERLDFYVNLLFLVGHDSLAVTCHRLYHGYFRVKFLQKYKKIREKA